MKMQSEITVTGMKASKGDYEGTAYDSTKVYALVEMDTKGDKAMGQATAVFNFGTSDAYEQFRHLKGAMPFRAMADFEIVTNGREVKQVLIGLKPLDTKKAA